MTFENIKAGDVVEIKPIKNVPNCERRFKVDAVLNYGFLYGCSTTCDGYVIPFRWVSSIKVVERG